MNFFNILALFGGLGLFLYGMTVMGQGLEKISGGKLEGILEKLTNNPIKGVVLGAAVTAAIQSSSATTVMLIGFVNSGIMRLSQAIGVIMGANIGTTITAWILSLTGLQSDNFFIQMLKPVNFSLVFAVIGAIFFVFIKKGKKIDIGQILLGFTVLIYGMTIMGDAVSPLQDSESFANLLLVFENPLLGVLLGAVVTAVLQSSSASVGILLALSMYTSIPFSVALPIILGQNIGTCVTGILSCIGANKNAQRTAAAHLYFNIMGTILFLPLIYILNAIVKFNFWNDDATAAMIALTHSGFNIACTLVFLPFTKLLEKIAYMTIRDKDQSPYSEENVYVLTQMLDERFLKSPAFALEQCKTAILRMADIANKNIKISIDLISNYSLKEAELISENEDKIDVLDDKISNYLVKLKNLSFNENKNVSKYLHTISDFERIGDHAENIKDISVYMDEHDVQFSKEAQTELEALTNAVKDVLNLTIDVFKNDDVDLAVSVEPLEQVVNLMRDTLRARHVERLKRNECTVDAGVAFNDLVMNFERISDHCSNIALYIIEEIDEKKDERFEPHQYLRKIRTRENEAFAKKFDEYEAKYLKSL